MKSELGKEPKTTQIADFNYVNKCMEKNLFI